MDARTQHLIVAIQNHEVVFAEKTVARFVDGMKGLEPNFITRQTLTVKLDDYGFYCFVSPKGKVYEIYLYTNPSYKPQKRKSKNA
ncbi:hypothetical protein [Aequorivita sp. Q41]|uniref:hypothetical protein n=1 Tax=Aequorivita sp. Q41 TaxID=3153300 RepID=UPI003242369A